jgi:hypothetical protein
VSRRPTPFADFLSRHISSGTLFLAGALLFPAFLFQRDLAVRGIEVALFFALNALRGRRIRWLQSLIMTAGIVVFNLVIPVGRGLAAPLGLPLTEGALASGLARALAVTGMIALSQYSIRPDLHLPGSLGGLIARSLYYFEQIMGERRKLRRESILSDIDALLLSVHGAGQALPVVPGGSRGSEAAAPPGSPAPAASSPVRTTAAGFVFLAALQAAIWGLLLLTLLRPHLVWP